MTGHRILACAVLAILAAVAHLSPANADEPRLSIELNRLDADGNGCRAYMLFENATGRAFEALTLDLVVFGGDGIVARRLAVNAAPLPADKTLVKVFDIDDVPCEGIGRMLLNGLISCGYADGGPEDCLSLVETRSRAKVDLIR